MSKLTLVSVFVAVLVMLGLLLWPRLSGSGKEKGKSGVAVYPG